MWNGSCFSFLQNLLWWAWQLMKPVFLWCVLSSLNLSLAKSQTLPQLSSPAPLTKPNAQHAFSSGGTYHRTHTQTFLLLRLGAIASASELLICHPLRGELLLQCHKFEINLFYSPNPFFFFPRRLTWGPTPSRLLFATKCPTLWKGKIRTWDRKIHIKSYT